MMNTFAVSKVMGNVENLSKDLENRKLKIVVFYLQTFWLPTT